MAVDLPEPNSPSLPARLDPPIETAKAYARPAAANSTKRAMVAPAGATISLGDPGKGWRRARSPIHNASGGVDY